MAESAAGGRWGRIGPRWLMLAGVLAWLWPIGLGGSMPVGGDATQFSIGLMAFLRSSILAGRLPLWNDLWGFGFPGLAESQMGVFYPPHLLLYGTLSTEIAYTSSLVIHTLWAALGANWAARQFRTSEVGAALAGFAWATSGFFLIHLPHQWGYTVGSWMPWAWGLAWRVARGDGSKRTPCLLAAVLALQVLPGHFQLAFVTEVGVLVLALAGAGRLIRRRLTLVLALASVAPLAAMQLYPTLELARLSGSQRGFEYLSGFAATPWHLVNYVAPGLFHRSPLWRPVAFDPFHTSPEELLGYVGLVPLFLALGAIRRGWRANPTIAPLAVVVLVTLLLSFGPYVPGFETLMRLPGFSFFRAPARWGLATNLALALLAGRGFDAWQAWPDAGRSARRFAFVSLAAGLTVVLALELALAASKGDGWRPVEWAFNGALKFLPWKESDDARPFRRVMRAAYQPQDDLRTRSALSRDGEKVDDSPGPTLAGRRFAIYRRELGESTALLIALMAASALVGRPRAFSAFLLLLTLADGLIQARHRPFDLGPARPLIEQSPVLARLRLEPRGTRTLDPGQNLFQVAGMAPVQAYRTLDLPTPPGLLQVMRGPTGDPLVEQALRAAGADLRVSDPFESRQLISPQQEVGTTSPELIRDPALAGWIFGVDYAKATGLRDFALNRLNQEPVRAWLLPTEGLDSISNPFVLIDRFRTATPLPYHSDVPERAEVEVEAKDASISMVVLPKTFDPEWQGIWSGPSGELRPAKIVRVMGGWQGIAIPGPGRWTLRLEYPGRAAWIGLAVSGLAWIVWVVVLLRIGKPRGNPGPIRRESGEVA